jgi:hypothetical protein
MKFKEFRFSILLFITLAILSCQTSDAKVFNATVTDINDNSFDVYNIEYYYEVQSIGIKLGEAVVNVPFQKISKLEYNWDNNDQILTIFLNTGEVIKGNPEAIADFKGEIINSLPFSINSKKVRKIEFEDDSVSDDKSEEESSLDGDRHATSSPGSGLAKSLNKDSSPSNAASKDSIQDSNNVNAANNSTTQLPGSGFEKSIK